MRSASSRAMARPRPEPCAPSAVTKGWKMRLDVPPADARRPWSRTARRVEPARWWAVTTMSVPGGVCLSALSTRMRSTWATLTGSQKASAGPRAQSELEVGVVLGQRRLELGGHRPRQLGQVDGLGAQLGGAGLDPREIQQVDGELAQALDLLADLGHEAGAVLLVDVVVLEQLDEAAEREDRRAQLVGGGGDERLAGAVDLGQLALHLVERPGQVAELVVGVDRDRAREVAGGDLLGRVLEAADAPRERAGHERSRRARRRRARGRRRRGSGGARR